MDPTTQRREKTVRISLVVFLAALFVGCWWWLMVALVRSRRVRGRGAAHDARSASPPPGDVWEPDLFSVKVRSFTVDVLGEIRPLTLPKVRFVRLVDAEGRPVAEKSLAVTVPNAGGASTRANDRWDLGATQSVRIVAFEAAPDANPGPGYVELLAEDGSTVEVREPLPRWHRQHTIHVDMPASLRAVVWDGRRPVFQPSTDSDRGNKKNIGARRRSVETTTVNNVWVANEGAVDVDHTALRSTMGLLNTVGSPRGVAVDRLVTTFPRSWCPRHACPMFLTVTLPTVREHTTGLVIFADSASADVAVGLGYGPDGHLRHMLRSADRETGEFVMAVSDPLGASVPPNVPVVIGLQYAVRAEDDGLRCAVVHPDGTVFEVDYHPRIVVPVVRFAKLWGNPDTDDAFPDPERRLVVHELRAYPFTSTAWMSIHLRGVHAKLVAGLTEGST